MDWITVIIAGWITVIIAGWIASLTVVAIVFYHLGDSEGYVRGIKSYEEANDWP